MWLPDEYGWSCILKNVLSAPICTNLHVSKNRGMMEELVAHCQELHMFSACSREVVAAL